MSRESRRAEREEKKRARAALVQATRKQPRVANPKPEPVKQPKALGIDHEDVLRRRPVWRFGDLDMEGPPSAGDLDVADFLELHEKLGQYETQTCNEIWHSGDNGCRKYEVDDAHENIVSRLRDLERDDETAVHTLRVNGKYRIYGVLRENVYYLLWIDHKHEMWPSVLRNT